MHGIMVNGKNRVRYMENCEIVPKSHYKYLSVLAADDTVKGVSVEGCKYPLKNQTLHRSFQFAVSNEISDRCAFVSVKKGGVFLVESVD